MDTGELSSAAQTAANTVVVGLLKGVPVIFGSVLIMIIGFIVARWLKWLTIKVLSSIHIEKIIKDSPVELFFKRAQLGISLPQLLGNLVQILVLLLFLVSTVNAIGLTSVSLFLTQILNYIPRIVAALLILVLGTFLAGLVEGLIKGSVSHVSISTKRLLSRLGSYLTMAFVILAAIAQLGIAETFINTLFIGIVAGLSLAFGLAFGLGAKDLVAKILSEWYTNLKRDQE